MKERSIKVKIKGSPAVDGAGVHLTRVLGNNTVSDFDPFLLLDSFDSENPQDYIKGFPMHPHRGIETITYLVAGEFTHEDSLGNKGSIKSGQSQWMTAGSGILHEEMPQISPRLFGLQFWLNLPKAEKMTDPKYFDITKDMIGVVEQDGATVRVVAGKYKDTEGARSPHIKTTLYDVSLKPGSEISIPAPIEETAFIFLLEGNAIISEEQIAEKTAVLMEDGDVITVKATKESAVRFMFAMAKPLGEPIAWGGPIVMNTREELSKAFHDLENGTFIKKDATK